MIEVMYYYIFMIKRERDNNNIRLSSDYNKVTFSIKELLSKEIIKDFSMGNPSNLTNYYTLTSFSWISIELS